MKRKVCSVCRKRRALEFFNRRAASNDGYQAHCRDCHRAKGKRHYLANKAGYITKAKDWERRARKDPAWNNAWNAWRNLRAERRVPRWVNFTRDILPVYQRLHAHFDPKTHTVDHVVPIKGVLVCGLHVPENLQILTKVANQRKGNEWDGVRGYRKDAEEFYGKRSSFPKEKEGRFYYKK